jgi:hypothetical protein
MPGPIRAAIGDVSEAIIKPVVDEGARMVEAGVQSVTQSSKPIDPQEEAKKKAQDQIKLRNVQQFIQQYTQDQTRHAQQVEAERQKKVEASQAVAKTQEVQQIEKSQKNNSMSQALQNAKLQTEAKGGRGIGG